MNAIAKSFLQIPENKTLNRSNDGFDYLSFFHRLLTVKDRRKMDSEFDKGKAYQGERAALLFFEPSTRTRFSFESACYKLGMGPLVLSGEEGTSLEKGERGDDTVLNIAAMDPKLLIIRCSDDLDLSKLQQQVNLPVINAGWGKKGHPTQAMLDALTMFQNWKTFKGKKVLFVGDILHSRVVSSHIELLPKLEVQMAFSGPRELQRKGLVNQLYFENLDQGLKWADAVIMLRHQFERHSADVDRDSSVLSVQKNNYEKKESDFANYNLKYGLNPNRLNEMKSDILIMHPGPVNHGLELTAEVFQDPRCQVFEQVRNGVLVREYLIRYVLGETI